MENQNDKSGAVALTALRLLREQLNQARSASNPAFGARLIDSWSRGYVFGLCEALLEAAGVQDDFEATELLATVHLELFGPENGAMLLEQSFREEVEQEFGRGRVRGAADARAFLGDQSSPAALAAYLRAGKD
ncbi:MAG: hypothetical protein LJE84_14240 [Gammaproteobacteria bacterium]|jgi:hypothetical protein|nr:hypothetical protein [Gammaproteobacteria bacterium]